jgi:tripartite-type tricarboxylate transporter receptor subunit TctC
MCSFFGDALQQAESGTVRMLAVTSERRLREAPGVPSLAKSGLSGFRAESWHGLMAPARIPTKIVDLIAEEIVSAVRDKEFAERLTEFGLDPVGNTPHEFAELIATDIQRWTEAVKVAGIAVRLETTGSSREAIHEPANIKGLLYNGLKELHPLRM